MSFLDDKPAMSVTVSTFYKFATVAEPAELRESVLAVAREQEIKGTILIAPEGINATIAGPDAGVRDMLAWLRADLRFADLTSKESYADEMPFGRLKVRLKREIVTLRRPEADPSRRVGTYVKPADWNALIADPDVVVIDTRNAYEVGIGTFPGAIDPETRTFGEFPDFVARTLDPGRHKRVAMFCTGGIRCEKATAFVKGLGFEDVFHLKGGILKYLEEIPREKSLWNGECFVFDERVAVGHGLAESDVELCRACRRPITPEDKLSQFFEEGVSCAACHDERTPEDRARYAERQKQVRLAEQRGAHRHIGS